MTMPVQPVRKGNIFTNRIGPLPMWAWVAIVGGLIIVWAIYQRHKQGTAAQASAAAATSNAGQVPQFVNQTFTTVQPPAAPVPAGPPPPPAGSNPPPTSGTPGTRPTRTPPPVQSSAPPTALGSAYGGPNVRGQTLATAIANLQKAGFHVNGVSLGGQQVNPSSYGTTKVYSFTPYSDHSVNIGLQ